MSVDDFRWQSGRRLPSSDVTRACAGHAFVTSAIDQVCSRTSIPSQCFSTHLRSQSRRRALSSGYGRYWDEDRPEWGTVEHDFAAAWRAQPKWVTSRSLKSVGANATLVSNDVEAFVRRLKAEVEGDIAVAEPDLAASLTDLGLIDEYHLYFRSA